jgi:hypothetical protein
MGGWLVVLAAAGVLLVAGWLYADRRDAGARRRSFAERAARSRPHRGRPAVPPGPGGSPLPDSTVLAWPPMIADGVTLRDWLVHYHPDQRNVWAGVVAEFHERLVDHPDVADYFTGVDRTAVQTHFLNALITITGTGVTAGVLDRIRHHHAAVRNSRGEGITRAVFDTATALLVEVLRARAVPSSANRQLGAIFDLVGGAVVSAVPDPGGRHARVDDRPAQAAAAPPVREFPARSGTPGARTTEADSPTAARRPDPGTGGHPRAANPAPPIPSPAPNGSGARR